MPSSEGQARLTMRGNSTAVAFAALDSAAEAQGASGAGRERLYQVAIERHILGVVSGRVVKLV